MSLMITWCRIKKLKEQIGLWSVKFLYHTRHEPKDQRFTARIYRSMLDTFLINIDYYIDSISAIPLERINKLMNETKTVFLHPILRTMERMKFRRYKRLKNMISNISVLISKVAIIQ